MPDAQNPSNPQNTPSPGQSGPARMGAANDPAQAASILDAFNRTIPVVKEVVAQVDKIVERMDKASKNTEAQTKHVRSMSSELRQALTLSDSIETTFKTLLDYQKRMVRDGLKANSYKEVLQLFQDMEKESKRLVEEGVFSKKNTRLLQQNTDQIRKKIGDLRTEMGRTFDKSKVEQMMSEFAQMNRITLDLAKNLKTVRLTGLKADIDSSTKAVAHLFGLKDRTTKYRQYAGVASGIREARELKAAGRTEAFNKQRAHLERLLPNLRTRDANGFTKTTRESRASMAQSYVTGESRNRGMGRVGSFFMGRAANDRVMGRDHGVLTKAGMSLLARGEGSIGRGVASFGMGALEGGATSIAELAAPLAPVLAGLEIVKTLFDKNQAMNAEAASLGSSGIFSSGGNAIDSIRAVRSNLNGPLYSPLGVGYEKNMAIAKALQEGGLSNVNLADPGLGKDSQGFVNGGFGHVQQNVYAYGRLAGLDSSQTVTETIKLVSQYKQSLESTHDFFIRINKEAATAGITTSKYLQIIDDVNSHYEKSNKLLEATVDTMRLLSVTGRNTAEDLQDSMSAITNKGEQRDISTSTYLNSLILADPHATKMMSDQINAAQEDAIDQLKKALGQSFDPAVWREKLRKSPQEAANALQSMADRQFADDSLGHTAASNVITGAQAAFQRGANFNYARNTGGISGAMALASSQSLNGGDIISQVAQTMESTKAALGQAGGFDLDDLLKGNTKMQGNLAYQMLMRDVYHGDPRQLQSNYQKIAGQSAAARTGLIRNASLEDLKNPSSQLHQIVMQTLGYLKGVGYSLGPGDQIEALQQALKDNTKQDDINGKLSTSGPALEDSLKSPRLMRALRTMVSAEDEKAEKGHAAELASGTRTTADIFADAFTFLFNRIQTPLDYIAKILADIGKSPLFGFAQVSADDNTLRQLDQRISGGKAGVTISAFDQKIQSLQNQIAQPMNGANTDSLKQQLAEMKSRRDQLQGVMEAVQNESQRKQVTQDSAQDALNEIDDTTLSGNRVTPGNIHTAELYRKLKMPVQLESPHSDFDKDSIRLSRTLARHIDHIEKYMAPDSQDSNSNQGTAPVTYNTYNSVGVTQHQDAVNAVNAAPGEVAVLPKVTK